jgi:hypothetical protein
LILVVRLVGSSKLPDIACGVRCACAGVTMVPVVPLVLGEGALATVRADEQVAAGFFTRGATLAFALVRPCVGAGGFAPARHARREESCEVRVCHNGIRVAQIVSLSTTNYIGITAECPSSWLWSEDFSCNGIRM